MPPSLQTDIPATPSARNASSLLAPNPEYDSFNAFSDWEWAAEVPLVDGIDLTTMLHFTGAEAI